MEEKTGLSKDQLRGPLPLAESENNSSILCEYAMPATTTSATRPSDIRAVNIGNPGW